jgi:hypothetical protein
MFLSEVGDANSNGVIDDNDLSETHGCPTN